jgi:aspartate aminotransferase-like enzyme
MGRETVSFHDPRLTAEFKALIDDLTSLWRCDGIAFVVAGSGTMAMEMGIINVASDSDRVLVCSNGYFGDRYINICSRRGFKMDTMKARWGETVTVDEIDKKLCGEKFDVLVLTHVETSTGVEFPLRDLTGMMRAKHPEVMIVVDGVASMGGVEFYMDWGVDVMLTCSQKCFGISPGLGILWAGRRAIEKRRGMPPLNESYVDFENWIPVMEDTVKYWGTPAVNLIWALSESVRIIKEEGLENRFKRHRLYARAIRGALAAMGYASCCPPELVSPTVTLGLYPEGSGLDDVTFRNTVYDEGVHIAGCFGEFAGKGFRIGHMGNIEPHILVSAIAAIERASIRCGYRIEPGVGLAALQRTLLEG